MTRTRIFTVASLALAGFALGATSGAGVTLSYAASSSAPVAQLSWSSSVSAPVLDLPAPGSTVTLTLLLTSGVTTFKGGEMELRWTPAGNGEDCLAHVSTGFRTSTGSTCTWLNRGIALSTTFADEPGFVHVQWQDPTAVTTCTGGAIVQVTFDLSACVDLPARFRLCRLSLTGADDSVTQVAQLGQDATLRGGGDLSLTLCPPDNSPPVIAPIADQSIPEGQFLTVTPSAVDPDGDVVAWTASGLPGTAALDAGSGVLTWLPGWSDAGTYPGVTLIATDPEGLSDSASFAITVIDVPNLPPTVQPIADRYVSQGQRLVVTPLGADPDGGALVWHGRGVPGAAFVHADTGILEWPIDYVTEGRFDGLTLVAVDARGDSAEATFAVIVSRAVVSHWTPSFAAPFYPFDTAGAPTSVATEDLDGDGRPDIVTLHSGTSVSVLLADPTGVPGPPHAYPTGVGSNAAFLFADLNTDGHADIAVGDRSAAQISVLLADGAGGFGAPAMFACYGIEAFTLAAGDADHDGHVDLVTAGCDGVVSLLRGTGTGAFAAPSQITAAGNCLAALGDFNEDGHLDLVTAGSGCKYAIFAGRGDGTFGAPALSNSPCDVGQLLTGDIDADGHLDLVLLVGSTISVHYGQGNGSFTRRDVAGVEGMVSLALADADEDGRLDFVGGCDGFFATERFAVMRNLGARTFGEASFASCSGGVFGITIADMNGDGVLDLVGAVPGSLRACVALGNPDGTYGTHTFYANDAADGATVDADLDGHLDVAFATAYAAGVAVMFGDGTGAFPSRTNVDLPGAAHIAAGDVNGDGVPDFAVSMLGGAQVQLLLATPPRHFAAPVAFTTLDEPGPILLADVTGDGLRDVVTTHKTSGLVAVLPGVGDGNFGPPQTLDCGPVPYAAVVADFNGDGLADLAVTNTRPTNTVTTRLATAPGVFGPGATYPVDDSPEALAAGDLTGDGIPDLVATNRRANTVSVLRGRGDGSFDAPHGYPTGTTGFARSIGIVIRDFDHDGAADVAVASQQLGTTVLWGDGTGALTVRSDFGATTPQWLAAGDLNHDGWDDLVVGGTVLLYARGDLPVSLGHPTEGSGGVTPSLAFESVMPNPSTGTVTLRLRLPLAGPVSLRLYDCAGREVAAVLDKRMDAGTHRVQWRTGEGGAALSSGVYMWCLRDGRSTVTRRFMLLR